MYEDTYCGFIYIKYIKLVSLYITIIDSMVEKNMNLSTILSSFIGYC